MHDVLLKQCDAKDGVADGMIFDPMDCDFDPAMVACKAGQSDGCIAPEKAAAIERVFAGPKDLHGTMCTPDSSTTRDHVHRADSRFAGNARWFSGYAGDRYKDGRG